LHAELIDDETEFGEGSFPPELDRVNWAAFWFGGWWALIYGVWPWFYGMLAAWLALTTANVFAFNYSVAVPARGVAIHVVAGVVIGLVSFGLSGGLALGANRYVWQRRHDRLSGRPHVGLHGPTGPVSRYVQRQGVWAAIGIGWFALGSTYLLVAGKPLSAIREAVIVGLALVIAAMLWLVDRRRKATQTSTASLPNVQEPS
jgi:hypothetical protein